MPTSKTGAKGYSLLELLFVAGILIFLASFGLLFATWFKGDKLAGRVAFERLADDLSRARLNAWNGNTSAKQRTLVLSEFRLPQGVRLVEDIGKDRLPFQAAILGPRSEVGFERITAKTATPGFIALRDFGADHTFLVYVSPANAPASRWFAKGNGKFIELLP